MHLSTKMRYGTRALVELAAAYPDAHVSVMDIAEHQGISPKYLEQIMSSLRIAGLVRSVRGVHGGYSLARAPAECRLSDVFEALEGSAAPVACVDNPEQCELCDKCPTWETWAEIKQAIMEVLERTTLEGLLHRAEVRAAL